MNVLSIRSAKGAPPPRDEARDALAAAIAEAGPLRQAAETARTTVERARDRLIAAQNAAATAGALLAAARERAVAGITLAEQEPDRPASLRLLRQAEADAADDVAIVAEGLAMAETDLDQADYAATRAERLVGEAADAVIAGTAVRAMDAVREAHMSFARTIMQAKRVRKAMKGGADALYQSMGTYCESPIPWPGANINWSDVDAEQRRISAPWDAARTALLSDAAAPLPEIG